MENIKCILKPTTKYSGQYFPRQRIHLTVSESAIESHFVVSSAVSDKYSLFAAIHNDIQLSYKYYMHVILGEINFLTSLQIYLKTERIFL